MDQSQIYIGCPNGVVVCVDHYRAGGLSGVLYNQYQLEPSHFEDVSQMIMKMEAFYDEIRFPFSTRRPRSLLPDKIKKVKNILNQNDHKKEERVKVMKDGEFLQKHGDLGTFIVRVQNRQNSSWQGRVTWVEKNETVSFRSALELLKLMEEVLVEEEEGETSHSFLDKK